MSFTKIDDQIYKKLPDIIQNKEFPENFNDFSLNARFHLNQIYSLLNTKRVNNEEKYKKRHQYEQDNNINENQKNNQEKKEFDNSEEAIIRIKKIQNLQKNEILQHNGFKNYVKTNFANVEKLKKSMKKMEDEIQFSNHKKISNFHKRRNTSQKIILPKIKIINEERKNENNENSKTKIITVNKNKNVNNCKQKLLRSNSCDTCCLYLDRPLNPKSIADGVKLTNTGGGLMYSNSIWRSKNINNFVSNYNSQILFDKIQQMKNKRYKVIYNKDFYYYIDNK